MAPNSAAYTLALVATSLLDISRLESGSVQLEAQPVQAGALAEGVLAELRPWAEERQLALRFSVQDTGPGLPAHVREQLFGKFVRGVGPGHGHGLGLAFCKLAVEAMRGRTWAESQPGQGTAFHFTLPPAA